MQLLELKPRVGLVHLEPAIRPFGHASECFAAAWRNRGGWSREITIGPDRVVHTHRDDRLPECSRRSRAIFRSARQSIDSSAHLPRTHAAAAPRAHLAAPQRLAAIARWLVAML